MSRRIKAHLPHAGAHFGAQAQADARTELAPEVGAMPATEADSLSEGDLRLAKGSEPDEQRPDGSNLAAGGNNMGFPFFENSSPQSSGSGGPGGGVRLTGNASSIYGFDILNPSGGSRIVPYPSQDDYNPYGQRDQEAPSMSGRSAGSIPDANRFQARLGYFTSYMGPEAFLDWDINEESSSGEVESASDPEPNPNPNPGPARSQQGHIRVTRSETKALIKLAMGRTSQVIFRDNTGAPLLMWDFADHSWQFYPALTLADDILKSESRYDSSEIESADAAINDDDDNDEEDDNDNESVSSSQREAVARVSAFAASVFHAIQMEQEQPAEGDRESSVARSECSSDEVEILGFTSRRRR
ncbi:unnamed protein product [Parascedosporium putredinis]|uniref:Uncharacterized protein n=1 Tax=Parascedosporium putredinis TaxID=1442378 RepID=A0A9P1H5I5_9PEZI|nr:unnamed protein product [Parascedosporium putredinis]CAI7999367.1 unnamed protein product [Parascedosporium putredinis]